MVGLRRGLGGVIGLGLSVALGLWGSGLGEVYFYHACGPESGPI